MAKYKSYLHVERLNNDECEGLLQNDTVYVTAKIDGTNACVWYDTTTNQICAGSRKRELNANKDNADFYAWVHSNTDEPTKLRAFCEKYPDFIVYGEWLGLDKFIGNIKTYDSFAQGHMFIFDVYDMKHEYYLAELDWRQLMALNGLEKWCVALLATLSHPTYEQVLEVAENNHFLLSQAENKGEGVVCKVPGWKNKYGHVCYGKIVLDEFHEHKRKRKHKPQIAREGVEHDIVEYFVTESEMAKAKAKVCVDCDKDIFDIKDGKMIGMYLNYCWNDLLDEMKMICKKYKNPILDMAVLNAEVKNQARKYIGLI